MARTEFKVIPCYDGEYDAADLFVALIKNKMRTKKYVARRQDKQYHVSEVRNPNSLTLECAGE